MGMYREYNSVIHLDERKARGNSRAVDHPAFATWHPAFQDSLLTFFVSSQVIRQKNLESIFDV
jgi:hypothetical protein